MDGDGVALVIYGAVKNLLANQVGRGYGRAI